jgi:hypothetical protein
MEESRPHHDEREWSAGLSGCCQLEVGNWREQAGGAVGLHSDAAATQYGVGTLYYVSVLRSQI